MNPLPPLFWLLIDGLSYALCEKFLPAPELPTLTRLFQSDKVKPLDPLYPNCQTPPSLFSIWSGCPTQQHQITGYDVPLFEEGDLLGYRLGFEHWPTDLSLVWEYYASNHQAVRLCAVPFVNPDTLGDALLSSTQVFTTPLLEPFVVALGVTVPIPQLQASLSCQQLGDRQFSIRLTVPNQQYETRLTSVNVWQPFTIPLRQLCPQKYQTGGATYVGVFQTGATWQFSCLGLRLINVAGQDDDAYRSAFDTTPYATNGLCQQYRSGQLGPKLTEQGSGEAEMRLLSSLQKVHESFCRDILWAISSPSYRQDLTVAYYPVVDLPQHEILALFQQAAYISNQHPFRQITDLLFLEVLSWVDALLAQVTASRASHHRIIINSDHGMLPVMVTIFPNVYFHKQGWLVLDKQARIDPERSLCYYHPAENGLLVFNRQVMVSQGIGPEDVGLALLAHLSEHGFAGAEVLDTASNQVPDQDIKAGDATDFSARYITRYYLCPPKFARAKASCEGPFLRSSAKLGDHSVYCDDPWLKGIVIDAGQPWLSQGDTPAKDSYQLTDLLSMVLQSHS